MSISQIMQAPVGSEVARLEGIVKSAFPLATGTAKNGNPWSRQDFIVSDQAGEVKISAWGWGGQPPIQGAHVVVTSDGRGATSVKEYKGTKHVQTTAAHVRVQEPPQTTAAAPVAHAPQPSPGRLTDVAAIQQLVAYQVLAFYALAPTFKEYSPEVLLAESGNIARSVFIAARRREVNETVANLGQARKAWLDLAKDDPKVKQVEEVFETQVESVEPDGDYPF